MIFKQMKVNSGIFKIEKLNLEVGFLKNWILMIEIFKRNK